MMIKNILFILLLAPCCLWGQKKKSWVDIPELVANRCNCPNRVISTDSVYSFLRSEAFEKYANPHDKNLVFSKEPISFEEITGNYRVGVFKPKPPFVLFDLFEKMIKIEGISGSTINLSVRKNFKDIDLDAVTEVFSAIWDSTTTYSEEIEEWNMYNIRDDWFTEKQHKKVVTLIRTLPDGLQVEQLRKFKFAQISRPVFNHDYSYALVVFIFTNKDYMPALFRREADGWKEVELNTIYLL